MAVDLVGEAVGAAVEVRVLRLVGDSITTGSSWKSTGWLRVATMVAAVVGWKDGGRVSRCGRTCKHLIEKVMICMKQASTGDQDRAHYTSSCYKAQMRIPVRDSTRVVLKSVSAAERLKTDEISEREMQGTRSELDVCRTGRWDRRRKRMRMSREREWREALTKVGARSLTRVKDRIGANGRGHVSSEVIGQARAKRH
nr:hypothetical protein CFP56_11429 [Quercus suber]